MNSLLLPKDI